MKKTLLLLIAVLSIGLAQAQNCERDSNLLVTGALLSPAPYTPDSPFYNLKPACIGLVYNQSVTVNVPATFNGFPIDSVSIALTGAISNLPTGVTYSCDPPNCHFKPMTLGCILLKGTVANTNVPDTVDLGITANVHVSTLAIPVIFPGQVAPGSHYYLIVKNAADCMSGTGESHSMLANLRNYPNPTTGLTNIEFLSLTRGDFRFEVFNLLGRRIYETTVRIDQGQNNFQFDAGDLEVGTYIYTLGNQDGKVSRLLSVSK